MSLENLFRIRPTKDFKVEVSGERERLVGRNLKTRLTNGVDVKEVNRCADDGVEHAVVQMLS